jgi:hypothetical protein
MAACSRILPKLHQEKTSVQPDPRDIVTVISRKANTSMTGSVLFHVSGVDGAPQTVYQT